MVIKKDAILYPLTKYKEKLPIKIKPIKSLPGRVTAKKGSKNRIKYDEEGDKGSAPP